MCGKGKRHRAAMAWMVFFTCQLGIEIKGAVFRVDGLTDE